MSYDAVVFDLDNTLYDEEAYFRGVFKDIAAVVSGKCAISQSEAYERIFKEFRDSGSQYTRFFSHVAYLFNLDESYRDRFYELYLTTVAKLSLYPDADDILKWLQDRDYRLGLITNGSATAQRNKIERLNLNSRFDAICVCRELGKRYEKPHIRPYLTVLEELDVGAKESVYIGDNPHTDFKGAHEVGMTTIRLRRGEFSDVVTSNDRINCEITCHHQLKNLLDS